MYNIYIDGIFDLFHAGHITTLKYIKNMRDDVCLLVGLINDIDASKYKRQPVINQNNRYLMLESCKYVDKIIKNAPLIVTENFINNNNIDLVVHGYVNKEDEEKQDSFFKIPKHLNKYKTIPYSYIESTTSIINKIKDNY